MVLPVSCGGKQVVPGNLSTDEKTAAIRRLYETLPNIECQGKCAVGCNDVDMSSHERWLIEHRHQKKIKTRDFGTIMRKGSKRCPALTKDNRCGVYEDRPLICRAWGVIDPARCPHGCKADRYLTDEEYKGLELAVEEIGGHHYRTSEDRRKLLRELMTPAGKAALKKQYDVARAEIARMNPEGAARAYADWPDLRGESVDERRPLLPVQEDVRDNASCQGGCCDGSDVPVSG